MGTRRRRIMGKIISYNKEKDREMRLLTLEAMDIALQKGDVERAKELGLTAKRLKERIETHDYTKDDEQTERIDSLLKEYYPHLID